eukprot:gene16333-19429_t
MSTDKALKIIVVGDNGVGKSSMILRYTENVFFHDPTVTLDINAKTKVVEINGKNIKLQIWDTLGQEKVAQLTSSFYKGAQGIILAYDSSSKESFERAVSKWWQELRRYASLNTPVVVSGCKSDLDKQVSTEMLSSWCNHNKVVGVECSSLSGDNIDEVFAAITQKIIISMSPKDTPKEKRKDKNLISKIFTSSSSNSSLSSSGGSSSSSSNSSSGSSGHNSSSSGHIGTNTTMSASMSSVTVGSSGTGHHSTNTLTRSGKRVKQKSGSSSSLDKGTLRLSGSQSTSLPQFPLPETIPPATQDQFIKRRNAILQIPLPTTPPPKNPSLRVPYYASSTTTTTTTTPPPPSNTTPVDPVPDTNNNNQKEPEQQRHSPESDTTSISDKDSAYNEAYSYQAYQNEDDDDYTRISAMETITEERRQMSRSSPGLGLASLVPAGASSSATLIPMPTAAIGIVPPPIITTSSPSSSPSDSIFNKAFPHKGAIRSNIVVSSHEFKYPDECVGDDAQHDAAVAAAQVMSPVVRRDPNMLSVQWNALQKPHIDQAEKDSNGGVHGGSFMLGTMSASSTAIFGAANTQANNNDHSDTDSIVGSIVGSSCGGGREDSYQLIDEDGVEGPDHQKQTFTFNSNTFNNEDVDEDDQEIDPYDDRYVPKYAPVDSPSPASACPPAVEPIDLDPGGIYSDLNERFQAVVLQFKDIPSLDTNLYNLQEISTELLHISQDFIHTVKTYGRIIIEERYLKEKTIGSKSLGGHLGGDKYIVRNVLFKFAGGSSPNSGGNGEWGGAKVGGQELKGCMATLNSPIHGICVPLMALVDFMGFRLIAMSVLPISSTPNEKTIVYGSSDMGRTVHSDHEQSLATMKALAQWLNLKPHIGGTREPPALVYSATDIEGHIGTDGRFYLIDFSRTFPPSMPDPQVVGGHLFQLFRPEFLKNHPKPLCSDAYSGFVKNDPNRHEHNLEVREATHRLLTELIPRISVRLKWLIKESLENGALLKGGVHIPEQFHRHGINMRWLGHMLIAVDDREAGFVLLIEAIARVVKNDLRKRLRETMKSFKQPLSAPYIQLTTNFLNMVFGESTAPGFSTDEFWDTLMESELRSKFYINLIPQVVVNTRGSTDNLAHSSNSVNSKNTSYVGNVETFTYNHVNGAKVERINMPSGFKLRDILEDRLVSLSTGSSVLGRHLIFTRFRDMTQLKFRKKTIEKVADTTLLLWNPYKPFNNSDLKKIGVKVKHTDLVTNAEGTFFYAKAMAESSTSTALHLLHKARKHFELALISNPNNKETLQLCAQTWCKILEYSASEGKNMSNVGFSMNDPDVVNTDRYFLRAIDADPKGPVILYFYARFLVRCARHEKAESYFLRSLEVDPFSYRCLIAYSSFLTERGFTNEAGFFLQRAQECKNIIVGGLK